MPCYTPLRVQKDGVKENGALNIVWKYQAGLERQDLPCGRCVGCRLRRSREWCMRCMAEAQMHERNCFITLTFNQDNLPLNRSLDVRHFQLFMKRLRKVTGPGIRFFHCGEYGGKLGRPHYHALLFGYDFPDKQLFTIRNGHRLYVSSELQKLWPFGYSSVGDLTAQSAAYVARYSLKKVSVKDVEHYVDKATGEVLQPEYVTMSRGSKALGTGGIGSAWFKRFRSDVYPSDEMLLDEALLRPPRYFDKELEKVDPQLMDEIRARRLANLPKYSETTDSRLAVKEFVKLAQIQSLKRSFGGFEGEN